MRVLLDYLEAIRARFDSDKGTLGRFKKISRYFTYGVEGGDALRHGVLRAQSIEEAVAHVHTHLASLEATPRRSADKAATLDT